MSWLERLQHVDRRIMYVLLVLAMSVPLVWRMNLPIVVSPVAQGAYDAVEKMDPHKIVIVCIQWDAGSEAENRPQTEALIHHLFRQNRKFAILPFYPQGSAYADEIATRLAKVYHKTYGRDWVHWGYRPYQNMILIIQGLGHDIPKVIGKDKNGTPLAQIPMMKGVKDIHDVGLVAEVTSRGTMPVWIAFIHGPYRTPLWYATTSVGAPEGFNWLDSGQIKGMLTGMKGAAEYERLLHRKDFATTASDALSMSQALIIVMIILGNIGYIQSRRRRGRQ
jgi:hypothetical protein